MRKASTQKLALSGFFLALGLVLPMLTGQIPEVGRTFLPMHIPVLLCGFFCGWPYGMATGFMVPLLRSMIAGVPALFPSAAAMSFELAAYGFLTGFLYYVLPKKNIFVYIVLVTAMIIGRIVWGAVSILFYSADGSAFTWKAFVTGALLNALPGIAVQLVLIPAVVMALRRNILNEPEKTAA